MHKLVHLLKLGWAYKISHATSLSHPPYQFTIEPTNLCNLKCVFCPQSDPHHHTIRPKGRLTVENFHLFLTRIKESSSANKNINFTLDGEPFNNRDFIRFVELAAEAGYFSIFASNGTLIDREKADRLVKAGPFRASIDFASDREVYETIRGQKGHFDLVRANLTYLMELSRTHHGVHIDIHDITPYTKADPAASLVRLRALFPADLPSQIRFDTRQFHNFCGHLNSEKPKDTYRLCPYPWTQMAVTNSGDCVPCCRDTAGRSVLGNVFANSVMEVWNGEPYQEFRRNLLNRRPDLNPSCKNCDLPYSGGQPRWKVGYILRSLLKR